MATRSTIRLGLLISAIVAVTSAQAQDDVQQIETLRQQVTELQARLDALATSMTVPGLLVANSYLAAASFHAMDETLHRGEIDPHYLETVRTTITAVDALTWPDELSDGVSAFTLAARELEAALEAEDTAAAAAAAERVHERQHALSQAIFGHLAPLEGHVHEAAEAPHDHEEAAEGFVLEIGENSAAVGGADTYRVRRGDAVAFTLQSAIAGEVHLHGYDSEWDLVPGEIVTASFPADATGRFPLEFHAVGSERGVVVGYLEVRP